MKSSNDSLIKSLNNFKVFEYDECARSENSAIKGARNVCETKKKKACPARSIKFTVVREFKFPRAQSYVTMPTNGGYSLGMGKLLIVKILKWQKLSLRGAATTI